MNELDRLEPSKDVNILAIAATHAFLREGLDALMHLVEHRVMQNWDISHEEKRQFRREMVCIFALGLAKDGTWKSYIGGSSEPFDNDHFYPVCAFANCYLLTLSAIAFLSSIDPCKCDFCV